MLIDLGWKLNKKRDFGDNRRHKKHIYTFSSNSQHSICSANINANTILSAAHSTNFPKAALLVRGDKTRAVIEKTPSKSCKIDVECSRHDDHMARCRLLHWWAGLNSWLSRQFNFMWTQLNRISRWNSSAYQFAIAFYTISRNISVKKPLEPH